MIGSLTALVVSTAFGAGLGSGGAAAVLGQPLDFAVQVRLDAGESLTPECASAEVTSGDRRLPPGAVRALVDMTGTDMARVRVVTTLSIDEPVVVIQLHVGCKPRISRRYVVLADPPYTAAAATAPAFAATPAAAPEAPPAVSSPSGPASDTVVAAVAAVAAAATTETAPAPSAPLARAQPRSPAVAAAAAARAERRVERRKAARSVARATARAPASRPRAAGSESVRLPAAVMVAAPARLKLDLEEPPRVGSAAAAVEEALAVVAQAASAARVAASAASASAARMAELERTVEQLNQESKSSRDLALQFRQRLADAEGPGLWTLPLMVLAGLLAALAAWLAWRLGQVQTVRQQGWREAGVAVPTAVPTQDMTQDTKAGQPLTAPIPFVTSEVKPPAAIAANRTRTPPAWPPPAPPVAWPPAATSLMSEDTHAEPAMQRTEPLPPSALPDAGAPRDVSIEELIDLEQQAEFFVVLGQDEAAVELLVEHLRSTGGGSPLPYLKLLEIHHRRNDREAYERTRTRFNHRFNAYAPEWGLDLGHGRSLDDYAEVIPRLQQVWPRPLDAMAELEALLFRKSRGELFDLPAYREVLFLYSLARDLLDRGAADSGAIDLLLPMAQGADFSSTAAAPYLGLEHSAFRDTLPPDEAPGGPLDFDVSAAERATSIFDLLDDKPQPPPRRS